MIIEDAKGHKKIYFLKMKRLIALKIFIIKDGKKINIVNK